MLDRNLILTMSVCSCTMASLVCLLTMSVSCYELLLFIVYWLSMVGQPLDTLFVLMLCLLTCLFAVRAHQGVVIQRGGAGGHPPLLLFN